MGTPVPRRSSGLILTCLVVALVLAFATPAQAHFTRAFEGLDYASVGSEHRWTEVCDMEKDGHGVFADFLDSNYRLIFRLRDPNGSAGGCGNQWAGQNIYHYIFCEDWWGSPNECTSIRNT